VSKSGRPTALIVGGGIAGSAAAIALQRVGVESVIFEARAHQPEGVGSFLTVATNGIDALRAIGADQPVLDRAFPTPEIMLRSATGKRLGRTLTGVPLPDGTHSQTMRREHLHAALADQLAAQATGVEHGRRLVDARLEDERVRAVFSDGSDATGDLLIGADGVHSTLRRLIDPDAPSARYERLLTTGGYARGLDTGTPAGSYEMIFGNQAFFGYVPAPNGETWWFANLPRRDEPSPEDRRPIAQAALRKLLLDAFADDAGPATRLIEATADLQPLMPIYTVPRLRTWRSRQMILIGDAAHAPSPTSGQGASLSIEDGAALAWAIRNNPTLDTALTQFEAERRQRVERIVKWASRMNSNKTPGPIGRALRDAMMPVVMRLTADSKTMRMPYQHHTEPLP
jgi:2-polyprenyl-6-methoxyphenol hydroxylase-like FAD-dependent oxidoreductase